ncbi:AfsA-related hotdog domain-containing protein [Streptomyces sp. BH104]|uniref:AfsA-related hotdog domain-containing protein n=1 Tax=unclassified Streptomyces TaxID=2593676 RepID=UPI003BB7AB78
MTTDTATAAYEKAPADLTDPASGISPTAWRRTADGEHRYTVRARHDGGTDPLFLAHAARQAALLIAHEAYAVPRGHHCVFRSLSSDVPSAHDVLGAPGDLTVDVELAEPDLRRGQLVGSLFRATVHAGPVRLGTAEVDFAFLSPAVYRFVRGSGTPESAAAEPWPGATESEFSPGTEELVFRGVPVDHIPGMLLASAAVRLAPEPVRRVTATFTGYTEPDKPCAFQLRSREEDFSGYEVQALQSGRRVYEGTLTG